MRVEIAVAGVADLDELTPLFDAYRAFFNPSADSALSRPFLQARLREGEAVVFVARVGGRPCGFIQLYPLWSSWHCKRIWFLSDLYVAPAYRKAGAGRSLVERVKAYANETGAASVMVELPHAQPHLYAFYDRLGFHRDDVFDLARYHPGE